MFANGDIDSPEKARRVLEHTGCDGLLIGRAAQGRPWIFREIAHYLATGEHLAAPSDAEVEAILLEHLDALHAFYGPEMGVRIARKHVGWYLADRRAPRNRAPSSTDCKTPKPSTPAFARSLRAAPIGSRWHEFDDRDFDWNSARE